MTTKAGKRPLRALSANEKLEAIRRVHEGESKASVARDIGVPESTLRGWCKNEDKIAYLSRQSSSPDTDGSGEPKAKRAKSEETATVAVAAVQPFNLSLKTAGVAGRYSPINDTVPVPKRVSPTQTPSRSLHTNKTEGPRMPASTSSSDQQDHLAVTARSVDALARLAAEATVAQANGYPSSYEAQLFNHCWTMQMQQKYLRSSGHHHQSKKASPLKIDINTSSIASSPPLAAGDSLLTTVAAPADKYQTPKSSKDLLSVDENLALWMQSQQAALNMAQAYQHMNGGVTSTPNDKKAGAMPTATVASGLFPNSGSPKYSTAFAKVMSDTILNWYKYATLAPLQSSIVPPVQHNTAPVIEPAHTTTTSVDKPILYQQLTKKEKEPASTEMDLVQTFPVKEQEYAAQAQEYVVKEPEFAAKDLDYAPKEQEHAEDLSTGKGRNSSSGSSNHSRSNNASPTDSSLTSSLSMPSPTNPTSSSAPVDGAPDSPASSTTSTKIEASSCPAVGNTATRIFNGVHGSGFSPVMMVDGYVPKPNGKIQNGRVVKPRKQLDTILAQLENHDDCHYKENSGAADGEAPVDCRAAIKHGEQFLRWMESG